MTSHQLVHASVVIATRDRASILEKTLYHLTKQQTDGLTWEIIVADNGSTDDTQTVLADFGHHLRLKTVFVGSPGKNRALNQALELTKGELVIFTDDDVVPCENWVAKLVSAAKRWPSDSVFGGPIVPHFPPGTPDWLTCEAIPFAAAAFGAYCPASEEGPTNRPPFGANLAIRSPIFNGYRYCETIGPNGSDYAMGSESELLLQLQAAGYRFIFVPNASVQHVIQDHEVTRKWLMKRAVRAGRGGARLEQTFTGPRLFGVPRYLCRMFLTAGVRYAFHSVFGSPCDRCIAGARFHTLRGKIREHRCIRSKGKGEESMSDASIEIKDVDPVRKSAAAE